MRILFLLPLSIAISCQSQPMNSGNRTPQSVQTVCRQPSERLQEGGQLLIKSFPKTTNFSSSQRFVRFLEDRNDSCRYSVEMPPNSTIDAQEQLRLTISKIEGEEGVLHINLQSQSGRKYMVSCYLNGYSPRRIREQLTDFVERDRSTVLAFPEQDCGEVQTVPARGVVPPANPSNGSTGVDI